MPVFRFLKSTLSLIGVSAMKKTFLTAVLIAASAFGILFGYRSSAQDEPRPLNPKLTREMGELMNRKLEHAQKILDGVARNDFDKIARHANELIALSNQAEWMVLKTPTYEVYSNSFRRSAEDLIRAAKLKNSDTTALAYVDLTMACVKCHRYVREQRDARVPLIDPAILAARDR
jgi:hypothetical protein